MENETSYHTLRTLDFLLTAPTEEDKVAIISEQSFSELMDVLRSARIFEYDDLVRTLQPIIAKHADEYQSFYNSHELDAVDTFDTGETQAARQARLESKKLLKQLNGSKNK